MLRAPSQLVMVRSLVLILLSFAIMLSLLLLLLRCEAVGTHHRRKAAP